MFHRSIFEKFVTLSDADPFRIVSNARAYRYPLRMVFADVIERQLIPLPGSSKAIKQGFRFF
jgi:hypothetical protein